MSYCFIFVVVIIKGQFTRLVRSHIPINMLLKNFLKLFKIIIIVTITILIILIKWKTKKNNYYNNNFFGEFFRLLGY